MSSKRPDAPFPAPMPAGEEEWLAKLHLSTFVNTYYQYRDLQRFGDACKSVLIIGSASGFDRLVLEWRGYEITTYDIDDRFAPDVIGSVHDLSAFGDGRFDAVVASHVLEHLAEPYLDTCLREIARVSRGALIYLPVHGRHAMLRLLAGFKDIDLSLVVDFARDQFRRPSGRSLDYMGGRHYWEVGLPGYRVRDLRRRFSRFFEVVDCYRNKDWLPSHNFVLRSL